MSSSIHSRLNHYREPAYAVDGTGQASVFLGSLQPAATPIIGRDEELRSVVTLLCDTDAHIVTLAGTAGVGKTRLAREIASDTRCSQFFENGIGFVPLETLRDAELVLPVIASAIGLDHPVAGDTLARLVAQFDDRRVLLVVDNFEQVGAAAPDIARLVDRCPGLTILVTSRRALNIRAEVVFPVSPLPLPAIGPEVRPSDIEASPAGRTLLQLIRRRNRAYSLAPGDAPVLAAICHHLDGVPLALELAAASLGVLSASRLLHRLENHASILGEGPIDLPPRQRTMHHAVVWSYDLLTEPEQCWFRRLAVLEGNFDLGMAQEVCDPDGTGGRTALDILTGLVRASLVSADGAGNGQGPRFRMLQTIRAFAVSLLGDTSEISEVRQRYASCMLDRVRALESRAAHEAIEVNYAGIRAALVWAWTQPDEQLFLQWVTMLLPYWRRSCYLEEGWLWLNRAVDLAQKQDQLAEHRAGVLIGVATMARRRGDFRGAEQAASESLKDARKAGDSHGVAKALNSLGAIALQQSHLEKARSLYQRALSQYRLHDNARGEAAVLHNIALVTLVEHEIHRAVELWEQALPLARKLDDKTALIAALRSLGSIRLAQGRVDCARRSLQEALLLSQRSHDLLDTMLCHTILTRVFSESRHFDLMATHAREAMVIARDSGDPIGLVLSLIGQARVEIVRGEIELADAHLAEAQEVASRFGEPIAYQPVLQAMGDLRRLQGELRGAFDLYEESFRYWLRGGDLMTLVPLLLGFADVASRLDQREPARRMLEVVGAVQVVSGMGIPAAYRDVYQDLGGTLDLSPTQGRQEGAGLPGQGLKDLIDGIFGDVPAPLLTDRERAVLGLLANGHTNAQMAEHLFVSPHTINTHVRRIYQKIGVNSRSAATRFALERGMVVESSANA